MNIIPGESMDKVSQKIMEDAKKESNKIIKEAEKKKKEIKSATKRELKKITEKIERRAKEKGEREFERLIGLKEIEQRNTLLGYKHELMNSLFNKVVDDICKGDKYSKLIESLFENSVESGEEEVFVCKGEKIINEKFIQKINKDKGWKLKLSNEKIPIRGGFILKGKNKDIDASIGTIIKEKRELLETELVRMLFGKSNV